MTSKEKKWVFRLGD